MNGTINYSPKLCIINLDVNNGSRMFCKLENINCKINLKYQK